jgi:hypothetical protein
MSDYGRTVQVVITIQNTTLEPETVQQAVRDRLTPSAWDRRFPLMVEGDTISAYYTDCECRYCAVEDDPSSAIAAEEQRMAAYPDRLEGAL